MWSGHPHRRHCRPPRASRASIIAFSAILVRLADVSPETAAVFRCAYAAPVLGVLAAWERRPLRARLVERALDTLRPLV